MSETFCITYMYGKLPQKIEFDSESQFNEFINSDKISLLNKSSVSDVVFHVGTSTFSLKELTGQY